MVFLFVMTHYTDVQYNTFLYLLCYTIPEQQNIKKIYKIKVAKQQSFLSSVFGLSEETQTDARKASDGITRESNRVQC